MPRVDDDFSATQGLAKVFAQAGAIDQGFSQAWHSRSFKHSTKNQHTLCNHESKVVFVPLQNPWNQVLLRLIRFRQSGSPISLTPGVVTVSGDHGGGSDVVNELFFSLGMWDPEVCHSLRAMECGNQPGHGKDPNVASL